MWVAASPPLSAPHDNLDVTLAYDRQSPFHTTQEHREQSHSQSADPALRDRNA